MSGHVINVVPLFPISPDGYNVSLLRYLRGHPSSHVKELRYRNPYNPDGHC